MAREPNVRVTVRREEHIEKALRKFKRLCERAGINKKVRSKRYYIKPSEQRRRELRKQIRNRRRAERKSRERLQRKLDRAKKKQRVGAMAFSQPAGADAAKPAEGSAPAPTTPPTE